jgi:hypothetical protein
MKKVFTEDGVGGIAQTNHLGPYTLTRLLEQKVSVHMTEQQYRLLQAEQLASPLATLS